MNDFKCTYKRRKISEHAHREFMQVSRAILHNMNNDVTRKRILLDAKSIRSFCESILDFAMEAMHEPGFFDASSEVSSYSW